MLAIHLTNALIAAYGSANSLLRRLFPIQIVWCGLCWRLDTRFACAGVLCPCSGEHFAYRCDHLGRDQGDPRRPAHDIDVATSNKINPYRGDMKPA
jgi:hypothetical protein